MMNFVQPGDVVTVTVSAGGVTSGNLIAPATSPVLYPIGAAMVRVRPDGGAVVAAGA